MAASSDSTASMIKGERHQQQRELMDGTKEHVNSIPIDMDSNNRG